MVRPDQRVASSAREVALRALRDIDLREAYANLSLDAQLSKSKLVGRDRALATELTYGTTRRRGSIDWVIQQVSSRPLAQTDPWVRNLLRLAVYQILYMDRIPPSAAVHEAVELAKIYGHEGLARFVNGVLRNLIRRLPALVWPDPATDPSGALAVRYSYPLWLVQAWNDRYGLDVAIELMEAGNQAPDLTIRANTLKANRLQVAEALAAEGVKTEFTRYSPYGLMVQDLSSATFLERLKTMKAGLFTVQDESSMLVAPVLQPQPGQTVIDMAAAPGGKATHLAELMQNQGRVIAVDIHPHKVDLIMQGAKRLGASIVEGLCLDARELGAKMEERADAVLCDAPCSGLGTLARRADARWRKSPADTEALIPIQRAMLESAARLLKPGGVLVYSTCTIHPSENQGVVEWFVATHAQFAFEPLDPYLPPALSSGEGACGYRQFMPHRHGMDGFFIARLKKRER